MLVYGDPVPRPRGEEDRKGLKKREEKCTPICALSPFRGKTETRARQRIVGDAGENFRNEYSIPNREAHNASNAETQRGGGGKGARASVKDFVPREQA